MLPYIGKYCRNSVLLAVLAGLGGEPARELSLQHGLDHSEMLDVVVCREQHLASVQLHQDAADAPQIRGLVPIGVEDHLGAAVLARVDHGGVMVSVKRRATEIDQPVACFENIFHFVQLLVERTAQDCNVLPFQN